MDSKTLQKLSDESNIREVLTRYCRAIDRLDEALLRSVYWPDAIDDHVVFSGRAMDFVDETLPMLKQHVRATMHTIGNCWMQIDGDIAVAETYVNAYHLMNVPGDKTEVVVGGRYLDRFERRNGEWRIAERKVIIDWEQNGSVMMSPEAVKEITSIDKRNQNEISYRLFARKSLR